MDAPITPAAGRIAIVDVVRGIAFIAMAIYHALWDLGPAIYGVIAVDAGRDPALRLFSHLIAGTFLFLVGASLVLAHRNGIRWRSFLRRFAILAAAAAVVTLVTWIALPQDFVRFGILHAIAAASLIGLAFVRVPVVLTLAAAVVAFAAPLLVTGPMFDGWALYPLGLGTIAVPSIDYVPLLPWLGATLTGIAVTRIVLAADRGWRWLRWQPQGWPGRVLALGGRWSLTLYLVHQPLLLALLYPVSLALGGRGLAF